jgi:hypothetical protein
MPDGICCSPFATKKKRLSMIIHAIVIEGELDDEQTAVTEFRMHPAYRSLRAIANEFDFNIVVTGKQKGSYIPDWLRKLWRLPLNVPGSPRPSFTPFSRR